MAARAASLATPLAQGLSGEGNTSPGNASSKDANTLVEKIWAWLAADSQLSAKFSRSEVAEMVRSDTYHADIAALKRRHDRAADLCAAIYGNSLADVERMLDQDPLLASTSCSRTGQLPLHVAVACGRLPLIKVLKAAQVAGQEECARRREELEESIAQDADRRARLQREWEQAAAETVVAAGATFAHRREDVAKHEGEEEEFRIRAVGERQPSEQESAAVLEPDATPAQAEERPRGGGHRMQQQFGVEAGSSSDTGLRMGCAGVPAPGCANGLVVEQEGTLMPASASDCAAGDTSQEAPEEEVEEEEMETMMQLLLVDTCGRRGERSDAAAAQSSRRSDGAPDKSSEMARHGALAGQGKEDRRARGEADLSEQAQAVQWAAGALSSLVGFQVDAEAVAIAVALAVGASQEDAGEEVDGFLSAWTEQVYQVWIGLRRDESVRDLLRSDAGICN